jgi:hypothetical protein
MNSDKILKRHTVTYYQCGRQVTDLNSQIRKHLHDREGWSVAIPAWAADRGRSIAAIPVWPREPVFQ